MSQSIPAMPAPVYLSPVLAGRPPRIALAYCGTSNGSVMRRLLYTLVQQQRMDELHPPSIVFESLLVTDADPATLPALVRQSFGPQRIVQASATVTDADGVAHFCLSRFRNAALNYVTAHAESRGYGWMILCDSDTVFRKDRWRLPTSPWAVPQVYWQKHANETLDQSLAAIGDGTDKSVFSNGNSWFMFSRALFSQFRFNEQIYGYGWEDIEFGARLVAYDYKIEETDMVVVHIFHPEAERNIIHEQRERNGLLTRITRTLEERGPVFVAPPTVRFVRARHPDWEALLALVTSHDRVLHVRDGSWGDYTIDGALLTVTWDTFPGESFTERDGVYFRIPDVIDAEVGTGDDGAPGDTADSDANEPEAVQEEAE